MKKLGILLARLLLWSAVILLAALPAVFMNSLWGYLPVLYLLCLTGVSLICLCRLVKGLRFSSGDEKALCQRGAQVSIGLKVENTSHLACHKAIATVYISDLFGNADTERRLPISIAPGTATELKLDMDMPHIGVYELGIKQLEVYDLMGLIHKDLKPRERLTALVTPRIRAIQGPELSQEARTEANTDTRVTVVGGMDYTGVREYVPGDPMKQIHWKLSAHSRDYLTKLQESSRQQEFSILLDFAADPEPDLERLMDLNDGLIETALSLSDALRRAEMGCCLLYCDAAGNTVRQTQPGDMLTLLRSFSGIRPAQGPEFPDGTQLLEIENQSRIGNTVLLVTSRITEELLFALSAAKQQQREPELYLIYPAEYSSRELEGLAAMLWPLEEQNIPYRLIATDAGGNGGAVP